MSIKTPASSTLSELFTNISSAAPNAVQAKTTAPFSVRLTSDERAYLEQQAGTQHLGAFIREQLLDKAAKKRRVLRKPKMDDKNLAMVLSLFGDQRIASNLNQLARHANMGTLDFDDEVLEQIQEACSAMIAVRNYLLDSK